MPYGNGLGNKYDIGTGFSPVNMATGANTGKRIFMGDYDAVDVVLVKGVGTAGEDPVITLQEHTVATGGTPANLAVIDKYWVKSEATLDNDETWTEVSQTAAATVTGTGELEEVIVFTVSKDQLSSGYKYVSVNIADVGIDAQLGTVLYVLHGGNRHASPTSYNAPLR